MAHFVIESKDGRILHDFSFHLLEAINFDKWFHGTSPHSFSLIETFPPTIPQASIPIGSVEFVLSFYKLFYGIESVYPLHIPESLRRPEYLHRRVFEKREGERVGDDNVFFVKSLNHFKSFKDFLPGTEILGEEAFFVSETIDIESEWRCFVHRGNLLDARCYSGDFRKNPNYTLVEKIISSYKDAPSSYTLDVGVLESGETAIIEVHQFFSCGLYGFNNYAKLIDMFVSTHRDLLKLKKQL